MDDDEARLPTFRPFTRSVLILSTVLCVLSSGVECGDQQTYNFIDFRDEMANIENRILEKKIADKKKEELRQKNIAVMFYT